MDGHKCRICGFSKGKSNLPVYRHIRKKHLKKKFYQCNNCDLGAERLGSLKTHFQKAHGNAKNDTENVGQIDFTENDDDDNLVDTLQPIQEMITGDMELDFEAAIPAKEIVTKKRGAAIGKDNLIIN